MEQPRARQTVYGGGCTDCSSYRLGPFLEPERSLEDNAEASLRARRGMNSLNAADCV